MVVTRGTYGAGGANGAHGADGAGGTGCAYGADNADFVGCAGYASNAGAGSAGKTGAKRSPSSFHLICTTDNTDTLIIVQHAAFSMVLAWAAEIEREVSKQSN